MESPVHLETEEAEIETIFVSTAENDQDFIPETPIKSENLDVKSDPEDELETGNIICENKLEVKLEIEDHLLQMQTKPVETELTADIKSDPDSSEDEDNGKEEDLEKGNKNIDTFHSDSSSGSSEEYESETESSDSEVKTKKRIKSKDEESKDGYEKCYCGKIVKSKNLKRHQISHIEKCFPCKSCGKVFKNGFNLRRHEATHSKIKPFQCGQCEKYFAGKEGLKRHMWTHSERKPFQCEKCDKSFYAKSKLLQHIKGEHPNKFEVMSSDHVMSVENTGDDLDQTQSSALPDDDELKEKLFECDKCDKFFILQSNLIVHQQTHSDEAPNKCPYCPKAFGRESHLQTHLKTHVKATHYCEQCEKYFDKKSNFKRHMLIHANIKPFKCDQCEKSFTEKATLVNHMFRHTGIKLFKCPHCENSFSTKSVLKNHIVLHTGDKTRVCRLCGEVFRKRSNYMYHARRFHPGQLTKKKIARTLVKPNESNSDMIDFNVAVKKEVIDPEEESLNATLSDCEADKVNFMLLSNMLDEGPSNEIDFNEESFENCDQCTKTFANADFLKAHKSKHDPAHFIKENNGGKAKNSKPCTCDLCGKVLTTAYGLSRHMQSHRGEKPFQCNECGKAFAEKANLMQHITIHTGEKNYQCHECGKFFRQNVTLKLHLAKCRLTQKSDEDEDSNDSSNLNDVIVSKQDPSGSEANPKRKKKKNKKDITNFFCDECEMRFYCYEKLAIHKSIHTDESPYKCTECDETLEKLGQYQRHMKQHPNCDYQCSRCDKRFSYIQKLQLHIMDHTNNKPYQCNLCDSAFTERYPLENHMIIHTGEKPFECDVCGKTFNKKHILTAHYKIHTRPPGTVAPKRKPKANTTKKTISKRRKLKK